MIKESKRLTCEDIFENQICVFYYKLKNLQIFSFSYFIAWPYRQLMISFLHNSLAYKLYSYMIEHDDSFDAVDSFGFANVPLVLLLSCFFNCSAFRALRRSFRRSLAILFPLLSRCNIESTLPADLSAMLYLLFSFIFPRFIFVCVE